MSTIVLGIDLGEASVGIALVRLGEDEALLGIERLSVRVFSPVTDSKKTPLNLKRQAARSARKNRQRRIRRKAKLQNGLVRAGLLPHDEAVRDIVLGRQGSGQERAQYNPYRLRAEALARELQPYELGRVFDHLGERRGFLSNKKIRLADLLKDDPDLVPKESDDDEETLPVSKEEAEDLKTTLKAITDLRSAIRESGSRTLGEHLWKQIQAGFKIRKTRTAREMFIEELDAIWQSQSRWHSEILSDKLYREIRETFDQRPLKPPRTKRPRLQRGAASDVDEAMKRIVKNCPIFPSGPVARRDHFFAHRFRVLQSLKNLRLRIPGSRIEKSPSQELILRLAERLQTEERLTWAEIRKEWGAPKGAKLSIEADEKAEKGLPGNRTERFLKSVLNERWDNSLNLEAEAENWQLEFMQDVETAQDPKKLFELLQKPKKNGNPIFPLTKRQAFDIAGRGFARKTVSLSVRAMRKLCKELLAGAENTYEAKERMKNETKAEKLSLDALPAPPFVPNPRVRRGLYEVRKVVNALIERHGKPDLIRIELARDIKETELDRKKRNKAQKRNQDLNDKARDFYRENGILEPSDEQLLRYRLWMEAGQECPYTGQAIGSADLLSERTEVDHMLPLPRSGDDSYANKVLTFREANAVKGNRTPFEWLSGDDVKWKEASFRVRAMKNRAKLRKFLTEQLDEDFTARQLVDTRYVCTAARAYLESLGIPVWVSNGQATGILRRQWGLNGVIPARLLKDPAKVKPSEKHRYDHRHHAVDALVTALTTPKRYREALLVKRGFIRESQPPTPHIREAVKAILERLQTSHDVDKGIRGALHDESYYGRKVIDDRPRFVRRIKVRELVKSDFAKTMAKLETVYDPDLRKKLVERLRAFGDPKKAFDLESFEHRFGNGKPQLVETVRVFHRLTDEAAVDLGEGRWVDPNSNHHAEIVRNAKGKLECRTVSMLEAARRVRSERKSGQGLTVGPGEKLLMTLAKDEVVEFDGLPTRVVAIAEGDVRLRDLNDARAANDPEGHRLTSSDKFALLRSKLKACPLGELTPVDEP
jgi:CRISPR-associated endonuclease Csn1